MQTTDVQRTDGRTDSHTDNWKTQCLHRLLLAET